MDTREIKGLELAARARIEKHRTYWTVPSSVATGPGYKVDLDAQTCTCDDFDLRQLPCKHVFAVRFVMEREAGSVPEFTDPPEPVAVAPAAPVKKPTYKQNWPLYNAAQMAEKKLFRELLADLCSTIPNYPPRGKGRPPIPRADAVFSAVYKVYSTFSGRRFTTDLRDAEEEGHVTKAPHYNSVFRVLEDAEVTAVLNSLVIRSSTPLKAVEQDFAADSSGFSTSKFVRWYDEKYGVNRKKATWVKVHLMCGVKTNVVTAAIVSDSGDCPMLPSLAATTKQNFTMREVSADKAYLSEGNLECLDEMGAKSFIPFKINSRGDTRPGGIWEKMFHYFSLSRDEFLSHYHKRSNVESTFSMIKRKFGDSIRSKADVAMKNEVLAKIVCHNIVCLIHEMHELGIEVHFGRKSGTPREPEGHVIRLPIT